MLPRLGQFILERKYLISVSTREIRSKVHRSLQASLGGQRRKLEVLPSTPPSTGTIRVSSEMMNDPA